MMSNNLIDGTVVLIRRRSIVITQTTEYEHPTVDQNLEQFKAVAIRHLIRKLDRRLIPFLVLLAMISFLDRAIIGHVKIMGIKDDLKMSPSDQYWFISIFPLAYLIFGIPSNLFLRVIGPTRYLSLSAVAWGCLTISMAFVKTTRDLLIVRFFLGASVAGFYPSMIIYFSLWYCKGEQTMRITIFHASTIGACAFSSLLAQSVTYLDGMSGLNNWQWVYIIEGLPDILLGFIIFAFLGTIPETIQGLNSCEKELLTNLLREDVGIATSEFTSGIRLSWPQVRQAFIDWRVYFYVLIGVCNFVVTKCLTTYVPLFVQDTERSPESPVHYIVAPIYAVACLFCLLVGYSSSRRKEISFHLIFCQVISVLGFILMLTLRDRGSVVLLISIGIVCCGEFAISSLILSWVTKNIIGHTKRTIVVSLVLVIGQIPGIFAPQVYPDVDRPVYRRGHWICIACSIVGLVLTIILRFGLMLENHRREHLSNDQRLREATVKEPCDLHPDIRYIV